MIARRAAFAGALGVVAAMFLAVCAFIYPIADDIDFASAAREAGIWTAWRQQYLTWNGRFTSNLLGLLVPATAWPYRLATAALIVSMFVAAVLLLHALGRGRFDAREIGVASAAGVLLYLSQMPAPGEGVYWYTSAVTYFAALVITMIHFALVVRADANSLASVVVAGVLLFVTCGFNELMAPVLALIYAVATALAADSPRRKQFALLLLTAIAGGAVVYSAPGNAVRLSAYPQAGRLMPSLIMTAAQTVRFLARWVTNGAVLIATVLGVSSLSRVPPWFDIERSRRFARWCAVGLLTAVPLAVFPAYWATGTLGQHRTANVAFFWFLVFWFAAVALWSTCGGPLVAAIATAGERLKAPLGLAFVVALAFTSNGYDVGEDYATGHYAAFRREMDERAEALDRCRMKPQADCRVEPIAVVPRSLFMVDISPNPRDWINVAYARQYGLRTVIRRSDATETSDVRH